MSNMKKCPVCLKEESRFFANEDGRDYWRCGVCAATYLDPSLLPSEEAERARYARHENDFGDEGYRRYLERLALPLLARLPEPKSGLDYGCGPGPVLAAMLREAGHEVALYDPFFEPGSAALEREYDFITCSEVAEHFHHPAEEFALLNRLLKQDGYFAVMTCFLTDGIRFADWHYRTDSTHVVFYREETFDYIARLYGWDLEIPAKDVAIMHKV